ncbi:uncharacterized protein LOC132203639 [Neocloeon triangulifer]|uniref:uncharacterized protein LOC132203639 n=1 Tax=Neocloeon triangulifer TaxID=2078957 RepID=UPI00286F3CCF|nr:uncharacterized protein LOC132203639 [Neocloeon triangulifer]XP_059487527.1 uncharacterized protein LOC132203639 [Neocloeon triangulifer]
MAEKQTGSDPSSSTGQGFEFPYEWVSQNNGGDASFALSKELAAKFAQMKMLNEAGDADANSVFNSLLNTQKQLEASVSNYDDVLKDLPFGMNDLQPESLIALASTAGQYSSFKEGMEGNDVMCELGSAHYEKELARMEMISQSLDGILEQIDVMKQQFLGDFEESDNEDNEVKPSECADFVEEKVAAIKEEIDDQEAEKFFVGFKEYKEVKAYLEKLEKEKKVEARLDAALAKFKDLPPDFDLAQNAIKKQEKEMKDLNAEIEFLKNNMDNGAFDMFKS